MQQDCLRFTSFLRDRLQSQVSTEHVTTTTKAASDIHLGYNSISTVEKTHTGCPKKTGNVGLVTEQKTFVQLSVFLLIEIENILTQILKPSLLISDTN